MHITTGCHCAFYHDKTNGYLQTARYDSFYIYTIISPFLTWPGWSTKLCSIDHLNNKLAALQREGQIWDCPWGTGAAVTLKGRMGTRWRFSQNYRKTAWNRENFGPGFGFHFLTVASTHYNTVASTHYNYAFSHCCQCRNFLKKNKEFLVTAGARCNWTHWKRDLVYHCVGVPISQASRL